MKNNMNYGEEITEEFQRSKLAELFAQCTTEQQRVFGLMYPKSPKREQLCWALTQLRNTLNKNAQKTQERP